MTKEDHMFEQPVSEWEQAFAMLYEHRMVGRTLGEVWLGALGGFSGMAQAIRRSEYQSLATSAAEALQWVCLFTYGCSHSRAGSTLHISNSLSEIVAISYPGVCGRCQSVPCACDSLAIDKRRPWPLNLKLLAHRREQLGFREFSFGNWLQMFTKIFGGRVQMMSLESVGFHLLEEATEVALNIDVLARIDQYLDRESDAAAEVAEATKSIEGFIELYSALRGEELYARDLDPVSYAPSSVLASFLQAKAGLLVGIADTFSWLCTALTKTELILNSNQALGAQSEIDQVLRNLYMGSGQSLRCPKCSSAPCQCNEFSESLPRLGRQHD